MGLVIVIIFLGLSILFTRPMLTEGGHSIYKAPGDPNFEAWTLAWDVKELTHSPLNLFNANIFYPNNDTLAYSDHQLTTAVLASPILALTGNPIQTANYMLIFNFFLAGIGMYLLANHLTDNRAAALIAGILYAFAPARVGQIWHLQMTAVGWIPLCLLFLHKYGEEGKWYDAALAVLFLVLQTLATWYFGLMLTIAIIVFLVVRLIMNRTGFTLKWMATLLIALVIGGALIAPFAAPYLRVHAEDPRFVRSVKEVDQFSADVRDFAVASEPNLIWGSLTAGLRKSTVTRGGPTERSLFPGLMPLLLGLVGAVVVFMKGKGRERFYVRYYVTLGAVAVILCLGTRLYFFGHSVDIPMPYDLLYYLFPGFKVVRVPARFIVLVGLALAVLAAFGVKAIIQWLSAKRAPFVAGLVALALVALVILDVMTVALPMYRVPLKDQFASVYTWLEKQPGGAPTAEIPLATYNPKTFSAGLQYEPSWLPKESLRTYYSTLHGKKLLNGYSGYIPDSYYKAVKETANFPSKESIEFLKSQGVKYVIVHGKELDPAWLQRVFDYSIKYKDMQPWKVFGKDYVYRLR